MKAKELHQPQVGSYYLHNDYIWKCIRISRATDEVVLRNITTNQDYVTRYALFPYAFEPVWKVGAVARLLGRHTRSIYRYETQGRINKPKMYLTKAGKRVRFYRVEDILEAYELISEIHAGRPRVDGKTVNNSLPDVATFKKELRERFKVHVR